MPFRYTVRRLAIGPKLSTTADGLRSFLPRFFNPALSASSMLWLVFIALPPAGSFGAAVTSTWKGTNGSWGEAANWNNVPGAGSFPDNGNGGVATYDVVLDANLRTITLDRDIVIERFTFSNGAVSGSFDLTLNDNLTWSRGFMSGTGTTSVAGAASTISGSVNLSRVLNNSGMMTFSGDISFGSENSADRGVLNNSGTFNATGASLYGNSDIGHSINNAGTWNFSGRNGVTDMAFNNTGTVNVQGGGTLRVIEGGVLLNNGTQTGEVNAFFGGSLKGSGSFGTVNVSAYGTFSPGNGPGNAMTVGDFNLNPVGRYDFELNQAEYTTGDGHADFLAVAGSILANADATPDDPEENLTFTVAIISLDQANNPAALMDFDATQPYSFTLATAAGGVLGFDAAEFEVDTSGFGNALLGGSFTVDMVGNDLRLNFIPAPEPTTCIYVFAGLALLMSRRRASCSTCIAGRRTVDIESRACCVTKVHVQHARAYFGKAQATGAGRLHRERARQVGAPLLRHLGRHFHRGSRSCRVGEDYCMPS